MVATRLEYGPITARPERAVDRTRYLARWLRAWVAVLVAATLVVAGFLVVISNALYTVADNVGHAKREARAIVRDVNALPAQIGTVNASLATVSDAVAPLAGDVHTVNGALSSVDHDLGTTTGELSSIADALGDTRNELHTTTGRLTNITGALHDTSSALTSVYGVTGQINSVLENAESPPDQLGAKDIYQHVALVNSALAPVHADTGNIFTTVGGVDAQLTSICKSPLLIALGLVPPC